MPQGVLYSVHGNGTEAIAVLGGGVRLWDEEWGRLKMGGVYVGFVVGLLVTFSLILVSNMGCADCWLGQFRRPRREGMKGGELVGFVNSEDCCGTLRPALF